MKIDGSHIADDLLQRMQEAHETQATQATQDAAPQKTFRLDELQGTSAAQPVEATQPSALEARVRETAQKALRGEFADAEAVRAAVVEDVLRERWEPKVGRAQVAKMIKTLKPTLVDDPEFTRQVDEMLVMAARQLGSSR